MNVDTVFAWLWGAWLAALLCTIAWYDVLKPWLRSRGWIKPAAPRRRVRHVAHWRPDTH